MGTDESVMFTDHRNKSVRSGGPLSAICDISDNQGGSRSHRHGGMNSDSAEWFRSATKIFGGIMSMRRQNLYVCILDRLRAAARRVRLSTGSASSRQCTGLHSASARIILVRTDTLESQLIDH